MAFFSKLKDRLFKSSSKLEQGLDAIVEEGGEDDVMRSDAAAQSASDQMPARDVVPEAVAQPEPDPQTTPDPAPDTVPEPEPEFTPEPEILPDPAPVEIPAGAPDVAAPTPPVEVPVDAPDELPDETPVQPDPIETPAPVPDEGPMRPPAEAPELPVTPPAETPEEIPQSPVPSAPPADASGPPRTGILGRMLGRGREEEPAATATTMAPATTARAQIVPAALRPTKRRVLDDDMLEQLEELLISADMGVDTALRVTANMAEGRFGKKLSADEIKQILAAEVARIMDPVARPMPLYPKRPQVVLVVGVNGSGKTTTIGKLASQFKAAGKSVVIAAGDTFRAAAVGQLQVWGERAGVPVLTAPEGSDPASLAFDAMTKAEADGADLLMIDTAGRLQNRADLMEELAKIVRVIRKKDPSAPHNTLLVLDATTGQNALRQVETFQKLADVTGLVMTKLDGTAKGGVLVALADKFGLPIHAIGVGEQIDDLAPFDPEEFAKALTGLDA